MTLPRNLEAANRERGVIMLYMNFQPTTPDHWAALSKSIEVAEVTLNPSGECIAAFTAGRALSQREVDSVGLFMRETEREQ